MSRQKFNATLSEDMVQKIKVQAIKEQTTASEIIQVALKKYFREIEDSGEVSRRKK